MTPIALIYLHEKKNFLEREGIRQGDDLIQQPVRKSDLSRMKISILIGANRETLRKVSKNRPLTYFKKMERSL